MDFQENLFFTFPLNPFLQILPFDTAKFVILHQVLNVKIFLLENPFCKYKNKFRKIKYF